MTCEIPGCQPEQVEGTLPGGFRGLPRRQSPGKSEQLSQRLENLAAA